MSYEVIKFENDNVELEVNVSPEEETAWLSLDDMAILFDRDRSVIGKHVRNELKEKPDKEAVWAKIARTGPDGKQYFVDHYNLDVIISVGNRVKSNKGIELKEFVDKYFAEKGKTNEIIICNNGNLNLAVNVAPEEETVWLNQRQIAELYETTRQNISWHINNVLNEGELGRTCCKEYLHDVGDGRTFNVTFYNLDVILAVGFRVKSPRAVEFRKWAFATLEKYLLKGYVINEERTLVTEENYNSLVKRIDFMEIRQDKRMDSFDSRLSNVEENQKHLLIEDKIFYENEMFEALVFMNQIVETAKESIVLIDPYTDERTLNAFKKKGNNVLLLIVASSKQKPTQIDIDTYKNEYGEITIKIDDTNHDRFLVIDNYLFYQLGSSINYLGKRFTTIDLKTKIDFIELIRNRVEQYL